MPPELRAVYIFHVYFTVRRILCELGGIQSVSALRGDQIFSQKDNHYDVASYEKLCSKFEISPNSDFRCKRGNNHGLGNIYVWISNAGPEKKKKTPAAYLGKLRFSEKEGGGKHWQPNSIH